MQHHSNRKEHAAKAVYATDCFRNAAFVGRPSADSIQPASTLCKYTVKQEVIDPAYSHDVFSLDRVPSDSGSVGAEDMKPEPASVCNFKRNILNPSYPTEPFSQLSGGLIGDGFVNSTVRHGDANHNRTTGVAVKIESLVGDIEKNTLNPPSPTEPSVQLSAALSEAEWSNPLLLPVPSVQLCEGHCEQKRVNRIVRNDGDGSHNTAAGVMVKTEGGKIVGYKGGFLCVKTEVADTATLTDHLNPIASSPQLSGQHCEAIVMNSTLKTSCVPFGDSVTSMSDGHPLPDVDHFENRVLQAKQEPVSLKQEWAFTGDQVTTKSHWSHEQVVSGMVVEGKPDPDGPVFAPKTTSDIERDLLIETASDHLLTEKLTTDTCQQPEIAESLTDRREVTHKKLQSDDEIRQHFDIRECSVQLSRLPLEFEKSQGTITSGRVIHSLTLLCSHVPPRKCTKGGVSIRVTSPTAPSTQLGRGQHRTKRAKTKGKMAASKTAVQRVSIGQCKTRRVKSESVGTTQTTCHLCGSIFANPGNLYSHVRTVHEKQKPYECHFCGQRFAFPSHLTDHVRLHTGERPFACSQCQMTFTRKSNLTGHMRTHKDTGKCKQYSSSKYPCQHCPAQFNSRHAFNCHLGTVHKLKEFISGLRKHSCELCKKSFLRLSHLKSHMTTHTQAKPFTCETCGKKCSHCSDLAKHKRLHSRVKPYKCELCEEAFIQAGGLTSHMARHHPAVYRKKHLCKHCGSKFALASGLTRHMFTHAKVDLS